MTTARQDATIRKIERGIDKLRPKPDDAGIQVSGYDDEMGDDIRDLESEEEGEGNLPQEGGRNPPHAESEGNQPVVRQIQGGEN
jgi:hypothetical protein